MMGISVKILLRVGFHFTNLMSQGTILLPLNEKIQGMELLTSKSINEKIQERNGIVDFQFHGLMLEKTLAILWSY
jgi:hypothetical protein